MRTVLAGIVIVTVLTPPDAAPGMVWVSVSVAGGTTDEDGVGGLAELVSSCSAVTPASKTAPPATMRLSAISALIRVLTLRHQRSMLRNDSAVSVRCRSALAVPGAPAELGGD
jgi:hypothetical protein